MGIAALAWFLGRFATMEVGDLAVAALYFLGRILLILSFLIVSPLVFIILFLFPLLEKNLQISPLIQEIQKQVALVIEQVTEILDGIGSALQGFWESLPVLPFVKPLVLWLFVGLLLLLVLHTASMARRRHVFRDGPADTPESISESGVEGAWFRHMYGSNIGALSKRLSILQRGGRLFGATRVRMIYASLMRLSKELGCPRRRMQTPLEFLPTLNGLFPNHYLRSN